MTQYTENAINPTYRTTVKANNITVWTIASESGYTYSVTVFEGKVTSCQREGGTTCPGYFHRGTCHHAALVMEREAARVTEAYASRLHNGVTLQKFNADVERENSEASLDRRIAERESYLPPLHGSQGFSLLK